MNLCITQLLCQCVCIHTCAHVRGCTSLTARLRSSGRSVNEGSVVWGWLTVASHCFSLSLLLPPALCPTHTRRSLADHQRGSGVGWGPMSHTHLPAEGALLVSTLSLGIASNL